MCSLAQRSYNTNTSTTNRHECIPANACRLCRALTVRWATTLNKRKLWRKKNSKKLYTSQVDNKQVDDVYGVYIGYLNNDFVNKFSISIYFKLKQQQKWWWWRLCGRQRRRPYDTLFSQEKQQTFILSEDRHDHFAL